MKILNAIKKGQLYRNIYQHCNQRSFTKLSDQTAKLHDLSWKHPDWPDTKVIETFTLIEYSLKFYRNWKLEKK